MFYECILTTRFAGMGNLLKVLTREIENYPHFFLDFESKCVALPEENGWMDGCMVGGNGGRGGVSSLHLQVLDSASAALLLLLPGLALPSPRLGVAISCSVGSGD